MIDEKELCLFFTDTYRVLELMSREYYQIGKEYASITQKEIATELGFNLMKANEIVKDLKEYGYVVPVPKHRGRYQITDKAKKLIKKIGR